MSIEDNFTKGVNWFLYYFTNYIMVYRKKMLIFSVKRETVAENKKRSTIFKLYITDEKI